MPLELRDQNPVLLDVAATSTGLQVLHQGEDLARHGHAVLARSADAVLRVEFIAPDGWQLGGEHEDDEGNPVIWQASPRGVAREFPGPTTDPLEVTLLATSPAGAPKKKKVYIEAKPGGALPDPPG